jgi:hypothetical protein
MRIQRLKHVLGASILLSLGVGAIVVTGAGSPRPAAACSDRVQDNRGCHCAIGRDWRTCKTGDAGAGYTFCLAQTTCTDPIVCGFFGCGGGGGIF